LKRCQEELKKKNDENTLLKRREKELNYDTSKEKVQMERRISRNNEQK
jgi:hypothetical protein